MKLLLVGAFLLGAIGTFAAEDLEVRKPTPVCPCVTITKTAKPARSGCACPLIFCEPTPSSERCHTAITSWVPQVDPYCSTATATYTPCDCPNLSNCGCIRSTTTKTAPTTCISCYTATETINPTYSCTAERPCPKIACLPTTSTVTVPKTIHPWCPSPAPTIDIYEDPVCPKPCCAERKTVYTTITSSY